MENEKQIDIFRRLREEMLERRRRPMHSVAETNFSCE